MLRPRERNARAYWSLTVDALRGVGPALVYMIGPTDPNGGGAVDLLSVKVAQQWGLESANPRSCFAVDSGYVPGVVAGYAKLEGTAPHPQVLKDLQDSIRGFYEKNRAEFEAALDG